MKPSIALKLSQISDRFDEVNLLLASVDITKNLDNYRKLLREHAELEPIVILFQMYKQIKEDNIVAQSMLNDPDMKTFAEEEIRSSRAKLEDVLTRLQAALLPKDPNDERNVFLEIRAGTGGDESALFAAELFRMYVRFAERNRWQVEVLSTSESDLGGYKEIIARISGNNPYAKLKFESGVHRVQRVPATEAQGRIHTSACTVAIMPEPEAITQIDVNPADIRIDTYRASGAGGQHINKTDSAVRVTYLPLNIVVECQDDRSQHKNKAHAMAVLTARIQAFQLRERQEKEAAARKSLIGSGDRSERIRTYNFPQGRVTDHRINLTLYKIDEIMQGDLSEILQALSTEYQAELLAQQMGGESL